MTKTWKRSGVGWSELEHLIVRTQDHRHPTIAIVSDGYSFHWNGIGITRNPSELNRSDIVFHQQLSSGMGTSRGYIPRVHPPGLRLITHLGVTFNLEREMIGEAGDLELCALLFQIAPIDQWLIIPAG